MAPDQARGTVIDLRADLFAIGVLLYEMLAGQPPFKGATAADVVGSVLFRDPASFAAAAGIPAELDRIVATALCKDRDSRYQTCALLLQDLQALARTIDAGAEPVTAAPPRRGRVADGVALQTQISEELTGVLGVRLSRC